MRSVVQPKHTPPRLLLFSSAARMRSRVQSAWNFSLATHISAERRLRTFAPGKLKVSAKTLS